MAGKTYAQVHRFRDKVALAADTNNGTAYLTAKEARKIARALYAAARSIEREAFADSTCGTVSISRED